MTDDEIDLRDLLMVLWRNRGLIVGIFLVVVVAGGAVSMLMPSVYRASCIIALGNFNDSIYTTAPAAKAFLLSDELFTEVFNHLGLDPEYPRPVVSIASISDKVLEISIETTDQENATKIIAELVYTFTNRSQEKYDKYKKHLSERLRVTEEYLTVLDADINKTREKLRNIDSSERISQDVLEMSYSRTLEYLQQMESKRADLMDQYLGIRRELDSLENAKILAISKEPKEPIKPNRILIVTVAGMLGLMMGIFAAFLREALGRRE